MGRSSASATTLVETTPKKARLTIAQLAAYDDVLTDILVDHVSVCVPLLEYLTDSERYRSLLLTRPAKT